MASDEKEVCPLCMEAMEADDLAFFPCDCRYQVCRFCWAKIINEENGLCPACRKEYNSEQPALYKPVSDSDESKIKGNRKRKDPIKKTKLTADMLKILPELRVVQPNLIFVVGLPTWICKDKELLKGPEYFGRYGKVFKVEVNQNQTFGGPQGQPSFSAYITYCRSEDAMRSIRELDQGMIHGRPLRVSLGTTKYCSQFLRGAKCTKHECMYLHELGDPAASFTKEEMQAGKHTEYMNKLLVDYVSSLSTASPQSDEPSFDPPRSYPDSAEEGHSRSTGPKSSSYSHSFHRSRNRLEASSSSLSSSHRPHPRRVNDMDTTGSKVGNCEIRRPRQPRSGDSYLYPSNSPSDRSAIERSWNPSNYESKPANRMPFRDGGHAYVNGYEVVSEHQDRFVRKFGEHKRGHPSRAGPDRPRARRNSACDNPSSDLPSATVADSIHWRSGLSPSDSSATLTDETVDLGFDPFRESQQGLAELLAAEMNKLSASDTARSSKTTTSYSNGQYPSRASVDQFRPILDNLSPPDRIAANNRLTSDFKWDSGFTCSQDNSAPFTDSFSFRTQPPPGFEHGTSHLKQTVNASSFFPNSQHSQSDQSSVLPGSQFSFMGSSTSNNNTNDSTPGTESQDPCSLFQSSSNTVIEHKFIPVFSSQSSEVRTADNLPSFRDYHSSSVPSASDPPPNFRPETLQQHQAITDLFAAAFNTASAMFNNRIPSSTDSKSPMTPSKLNPPFDLNAFFAQLCRQSPLFAALNGGCTPTSDASSEYWNGTSRSWDQPPGVCGDCPSTYSEVSLLQQTAKSVLKPLDSIEHSFRPAGTLPTHCTLPPGIPKQGISFNSDPTTDKGTYPASPGQAFRLSFESPSSGNLNNTAQSAFDWRQSSVSNLPVDLLQEMWQSRAAIVPPTFETSTSHLPNSYPSHVASAPSGQTANQLSPRPTLRDPSTHPPPSHAQSTD